MLRALVLLALLSTSTLAAPTFVRAKGVFKIDDTGKVTRVVNDKDLPIIMTVDKDGDVWVSSVGGKVVAHKKAKRTIQLPSKSENSKFPVAMIAAKDGGIWALGREQLFRITKDGKLAKHALFVDRLLGPANLLEVGDVVWVASENGIHQFAANKWTAARTGRHEHLARDSSGGVWSVMHPGKDKPDVLVGFDGLKWNERTIKGDGVSALAAGKDGRLYVAVFGKSAGIHILDTKPNATWAANAGGGSGSVSELVVDDNARVWVRSGSTISVLNKELKLQVAFEPGALFGVQGNPLEIVVAGGGPSTLPSPSTPATGTITGRFMKTAKEPLANTKLLLCVGDCNDAAPKVEITTDADGKFKADVSAIEYTSIQLGTTIHSIGNFNAGKLACCLKVPAGKTLDLGTLRAP